MELEMSGAPVSATSVHPGGIKTHITRNLRGDANLEDIGLDDKNAHEKFGRLFITSPDEAVDVILSAVKKNKRQVLVGRDAYIIDGMARLLPGRYQHLAKRFVLRSLG